MNQRLIIVSVFAVFVIAGSMLYFLGLPIPFNYFSKNQINKTTTQQTDSNIEVDISALTTEKRYEHPESPEEVASTTCAIVVGKEKIELSMPDKDYYRYPSKVPCSFELSENEKEILWSYFLSTNKDGKVENLQTDGAYEKMQKYQARYQDILIFNDFINVSPGDPSFVKIYTKIKNFDLNGDGREDVLVERPIDNDHRGSGGAFLSGLSYKEYEFLLSNSQGEYTRLTFTEDPLRIIHKEKVFTNFSTERFPTSDRANYTDAKIIFKNGKLSFKLDDGKVVEYVYNRELNTAVLHKVISAEGYALMQSSTVDFLYNYEKTPENIAKFSKVKALVPDGYVLGKWKEGKEYSLGIIYSRTEPNTKRGLLIVKKEKDGTYTTSFVKKDMFPQEKYPENQYDLSVEIDQKDSITYSSYTGIKKYRYQNGDWYLIGATVSYQDYEREKKYKDRFMYMYTTEDFNYLTGKKRTFDKIFQDSEGLDSNRPMGYYEENEVWSSGEVFPLEKLSNLDDSKITNAENISKWDSETKSHIFYSQRDGYSLRYSEPFHIEDEKNGLYGGTRVLNFGPEDPLYSKGGSKGSVSISINKKINMPEYFDFTDKKYESIDFGATSSVVLINNEGPAPEGEFASFYAISKDKKFVYTIYVWGWNENKEAVSKILSSFQIE